MTNAFKVAFALTAGQHLDPGERRKVIAPQGCTWDSAGRVAAAFSIPSFVLTTTGLGPSEVAARNMRSVLVRCLVVLLAVALSSGNAFARLHPILADQPASHAQHQHDHAGHSGQPKPQQDKGLRCCCDNLGCVPGYTLTPNLGTIVPAIYGTAIDYGRQAVVLRGRALLPEPKPPRPTALT